ncbi:MAG: transposase [Bacteroidota bacterium]
MVVDLPSTFYRRHLPHYQPPGATFFATFRLIDSLPVEVVAGLKEDHKKEERILMRIEDKQDRDYRAINQRKRYFSKFDEALNRCSSSPQWFNKPAVADTVKEAIHYRNGNEYGLLAYCIMPNHVHMVFSLETVGRRGSSPQRVTKILENLKWYTAKAANKILGRKGAFWQHESYDHVVRGPRELKRIVAYVLNNPVKAGLVKSWEGWSWSYVHKDVAF